MKMNVKFAEESAINVTFAESNSVMNIDFGSDVPLRENIKELEATLAASEAKINDAASVLAQINEGGIA